MQTSKDSFKVLAIDDEHNILKAIALILEAHGHQFVGVYDKLEAVQILKNEKFDFILLDMQFQENEFEGLEILKQIRNLTDAYIIILTGSTISSKIIFASFQEGAILYLLKSDLHRIPEIMQEVVDGRNPMMLFALEVKANNLTRTEKELIYYFDQDMNLRQISRIQSVSEEATQKQLMRLKKKLKLPLKKFIEWWTKNCHLFSS